MNFQPSVVSIDIESCVGGLSNSGPSEEITQFKKNSIVLVHEGGSSLPLKSTSIKLQGYGNSFTGSISEGTAMHPKGDMLVFYHDLIPEKKNPIYEDRNEATLKDGYWDAGERLVLCGADSAIGTVDSSVKVVVGEVKDTKDNYGFKVGSEITVAVIDARARNLLAKRTVVVEAVNN